MVEGNRNSGQKGVRAFFAIWPDPVAKSRLIELGGKLQRESICSGHATKGENIHLTLAFLGEMSPSRLATLFRLAAEIPPSAARAFDLVIEKIGYRKHKGILYAGVDHIPDELDKLVQTLHSTLISGGFMLESRPYWPHITLMRHASCSALPELSEWITWQAREWMLIKSEQTSGGSVYTPIGRWSLAAIS